MLQQYEGEERSDKMVSFLHDIIIKQNNKLFFHQDATKEGLVCLSLFCFVLFCFEGGIQRLNRWCLIKSDHCQSPQPVHQLCPNNPHPLPASESFDWSLRWWWKEGGARCESAEGEAKALSLSLSLSLCYSNFCSWDVEALVPSILHVTAQLSCSCRQEKLDRFGVCLL